MPSPIGHAIAGAAIGVAATPDNPRVVATCAALGVAADLDLLFPATHRTITHSVTAVAIVSIVAIVVTGKVISTRRFAPRSMQAISTRRFAPRSMQARIVAACAIAYVSHLLLDWLGADPVPPRGLQILWPFSEHWFISDWDVFRGTTRRELLTAHAWWINLTAIAQEVAILGPVAWLA